MRGASQPLGTFLYKVDADQIRALLAREGLDASVRAADDNPPGWKNSCDQKGFVVWVQGVDFNVAMEIFFRVHAEAFPRTPPDCEVCGSETATHHMTIINRGKRTERHLSAKCHEKEPAQ